MTDKRNTSDAREKDLRDAHLGQNEAAEEKEGKEKMSHMGRSGDGRRAQEENRQFQKEGE